MNRSFIRGSKNSASQGMDRKLISVIGIGQGVGTTTVATTLAFCFAEKGKRVTFLEGTKGSRADNLLYSQVAMDQRFASRSFTDFYGIAAKGESLLVKDNFEEGINWILMTPESRQDRVFLDEAQRNRLLRRGSSEVTILDIADNTGWEESLIDSDFIIAVVDPLPSKMITNVDSFRKVRKLESRGYRVIWVVNKYNKGVSRHQVKDYLKSGNITWINNVAIEKIYAQQYACRFHWGNEEIRSKILEICDEVSQGKSR